MLWRVRTTLPDRPGALAALARRCGDEGVNILGLQIFPGVGAVTDELVLRTPVGWGGDDIARLLTAAGGLAVSSAPCTEAALTDQPTRYVRAAQAILDDPASFPEVVALLFDAETEAEVSALPEGSQAGRDALSMAVGEIQVQVRRRAPFTGVEHARGSALADLVSDVLARERREVRTPSRDAAPSYLVQDGRVRAVTAGGPVGEAVISPTAEEPGVHAVTLWVEPAWQRRGIGSRLLVDAARLARAGGATEMLLTTGSDNRAVLPMVLAAGLRGRIRLSADVLTVRVSVRELVPLQA
ncbi:GNAT family N-acetyltransferase [Nocardioides sp.]|uniref:GNAT family N-acetyltransferase n=1 Tax=Nocardioides sp. TaxID=35761 RepID=UPI0035693DF7